MGLLAIWMIFSVLPVFAQTGGGGTGGGTPIEIIFPNPLASSTCSTADPAGGGALSCILNDIIDKLIILAVPIVTILVIYGAFQILTSAGNPERVKSGSKTLMYTAIGFAIILISKGVAMILRDVLGA